MFPETFSSEAVGVSISVSTSFPSGVTELLTFSETFSGVVGTSTVSETFSPGITASGVFSLGVAGFSPVSEFSLPEVVGVSIAVGCSTTVSLVTGALSSGAGSSTTVGASFRESLVTSGTTILISTGVDSSIVSIVSVEALSTV